MGKKLEREKGRKTKRGDFTASSFY